MVVVATERVQPLSTISYDLSNKFDEFLISWGLHQVLVIIFRFDGFLFFIWIFILNWFLCHVRMQSSSWRKTAAWCTGLWPSPQFMSIQQASGSSLRKERKLCQKLSASVGRSANRPRWTFPHGRVRDRKSKAVVKTGMKIWTFLLGPASKDVTRTTKK